MSETTINPLRLLGRAAAQIVVGVYIVVDSVLGPLFRPFMRWLSRLHVVQRVEAGIAALPPYAVLVLFAVPLAIEEVTKFYGLVLMSGGRVRIGMALYVGAHIFAILVCERIFSAGKAKLLTIPWFAKGFRWFESYKNKLVAWVKSTAFFQNARRWKEDARQTARLWVRRLRSAWRR